MEKLMTYIDEVGPVEFYAEYGIYMGELAEISISNITVRGNPVEQNTTLTYELSKVAEREWHKEFKHKYEAQVAAMYRDMYDDLKEG